MLNAFLVTGIMLLVVAHSAMLEPAPAARYTFDEDARDQKHPIKDVEPDARYTIEDKMIGDLHTKVLTNTLTGEYVQMVTDLGGRVEDLVLQGSDGKLRSVLLTHHNNATAIKEDVRWWRNAILLPYANRIDGVSYI